MTRYVQAIYDFATTEPGEISLRVGDVVQVIHKVDENWLYGSLYGHKGNFPAGFAQNVELPRIQTGQKVFVATRSFPAEVNGDLDLRKGDLVVGVKPVNGNWWQGQKGQETGIFPVTHVYELHVAGHEIHDDVVRAMPVTPSTPQPVPTPPDASAHSECVAKGRVNMDLSAQLEEELELRVGDVITITEIIDNDFAVGHCDGRRGQFPLGFVDIIEGEVKPPKQEQAPPTSKFNWWKQDAVAANKNVVQSAPESIPAATPSACDIHRSDQRLSESTLESSLRSNPDMNSASSSEHSSRTAEPHITRQDSVPNDDAYKETELTPYATTLFPFTAENPNELSFPANVIINLHRHIGSEWTEGEYDGKRGIFPSSFIQILVDCPTLDKSLNSTDPSEVLDTSNAGLTIATNNGESTKDTDDPGSATETTLEELSTSTSLSQSVASSSFEEPAEEQYGRALFDFKAETAKDLEMKEGDTVTILRRVDSNWVEAHHDDGRTGLVPVNYIEVIGMEPMPETPLPVKNRSKESKQDGDSTVEIKETVKPCDLPQALSMTSQTPESSPHRNETVPESKPAMEPHVPDVESVTVSQSSAASPDVSVPMPVNGVPSVSGRTAEKPTIKPRVQPRPKPTPKPKPAIAARTRSGQKPAVMPRRQATCDARSSPTEATTGRLQKAVSLDTSLNDIIQSELRLANEKARSGSDSGPDEAVTNPHSNRHSISTMDQSWHPMTSSVSSIMETEEEDTFTTPVATTAARPIPTRPPPPPPSASSPPPRSTITRPAPPRPKATVPRLQSVPSRAPVIPARASKPDSPEPRPVPSRAAPPRPGHTPPNRPPSVRRKKKPGDLMDFSPENSHIEPEEPENNEVIQDLDRRISDVQADLQKYADSKSTLEGSLAEQTLEEQSEAQETLEFYTANITGLSEELKQLKASLHELVPERAAAEAAAEKRAEEARIKREQDIQRMLEQRERRKEQRKKVIEEVVKTEQDFLQSMHLLIGVFLGPDVEQCPLVDNEALFGNIDEVVEVSQKLLTLLEGVTQGKTFSEQILGKPFVELKEDLKKVYAPYCRNHDDVITLLEKYEQNPEIQAYMVTRLDIMRQQGTVFDMGSVLIKPVQRIMKYPLLLNELEKATEDDHPDKKRLRAAIGAMTDVATAINEYKRRKDLVLKYRKDTTEKLTDKIARLSMHSTKKKLIRVTQRMYGPQTVDPNFNLEEKKFLNLEKGVRTFVRDVGLYLEALQEAGGCQETVANDISDFYAEKCCTPEVEQFCRVHNQLATNLMWDFKSEVENQVLLPLNQLLAMFQGPNKVIKKRHDKLLDYDNLSSKVQGYRNEAQTKSMAAEVQQSKNVYEALNAQLLDELPKLYSLSMEIVRECVVKLVQSQRSYLSRAIEEIYQLLGLQLVLDVDETNIIETFNIAHTAVVEKMTDISFVTKAFNPRVEERRSSRKKQSLEKPPWEGGISGNQSDSQRMYLRQLFSADKLFSVTEDVSDTQMMGLACARGTMVGVLKEGDPMGNKERWYIDTGAMKGFLPKRVLVPVRASMLMEDSADGPDLVDLSSPQKKPVPLAADFQTILEPTSVWYDKTAAGNDSAEACAVGINWTGGRDSVCSIEDAYMMPENEAVTVEPDEHKVPLEGPSVQATEGAYGLGEECYQAVYTFAARSDIEVSMTHGDLVKVVSKEDLDGNNEWWLVEVNGHQGYAPANYLYQVQQLGPPS